MAYTSCGKCGAINRAQDTACYQCGDPLEAPPPPPGVSEAPPPPPPFSDAPPPPPGVSTAPSQPQSAFAGAVQAQALSDPALRPKPRDLEARYERRELPKVDSGVMHGLRSGLLAGLLVGLIAGGIRQVYTDEVSRLLHLRFHFELTGGPMFGASVALDALYGMFIGAILGATNTLCFQPESTRMSAVIGVLTSVVLVLVAKGSYPAVILGLVHGAALGYLASGFERKFRRL